MIVADLFPIVSRRHGLVTVPNDNILQKSALNRVELSQDSSEPMRFKA